jgi:uncharacterized membrane protein YphA (DoxX/SURF4 family)
MKVQKFGYWGLTALVAFAFGAGGVMDLLRGPAVMAGMAHLGYPAYVATLLGVWKVLGAVAVLVPGFPRVKEWAYAGMFFDLTGAAFSHASSGDEASHVLTPLVLLGLVIGSYLLRPERRRLAGAEGARGDDAQRLATA